MIIATLAGDAVRVSQQKKIHNGQKMIAEREIFCVAGSIG